MKIRWKAQNPRHTHAYYVEPYTVQHFVDWVGQMVVTIPQFLWFAFRHLTSKKYRMDVAREYNDALFGNVPDEQIMVFDGEKMRPIRDEEKTWPLSRWEGFDRRPEWVAQEWERQREKDRKMQERYGPDVVEVTEGTDGLWIEYRDGTVKWETF